MIDLAIQYERVVSFVKENLKKNRVSILLLLELFVLMPYQSVKIAANVYDITVYLKYIFLLFEVIVFLDNRKSNYISTRRTWTDITKTEILYLLYVLYEVPITFCKSSTSFTAVAGFASSLILLYLILSRYIQNEFETALKTISVFFWIGIFLNFISLLIFPDGLYISTASSGNMQINYFLGLDNAFGRFVFPGFTLIWYTDKTLERKYNFYSISALIMILLTYIITRSGGGLCAAIVLGVLYIIYHLNVMNEIISIRLFMTIIIVLSAGLLMGSTFIYNNSFISNFIISYLNKDLTFSGRLEIWQAGLKQFLKSPIFGYGFHTSDDVVILNGYYRIAHNFWLQTLLEGGIIGLALLGGFMANCIKDACTSIYLKTNKIFFIGIFATFIYLLMESGQCLVYVMILFLVMNFANRDNDNLDGIVFR